MKKIYLVLVFGVCIFLTSCSKNDATPPLCNEDGEEVQFNQ